MDKGEDSIDQVQREWYDSKSFHPRQQKLPTQQQLQQRQQQQQEKKVPPPVSEKKPPQKAGRVSRAALECEILTFENSARVMLNTMDVILQTVGTVNNQRDPSRRLEVKIYFLNAYFFSRMYNLPMIFFS